MDASYDQVGDVLYVSKHPRPKAAWRSREESPGLVWRYDERGGLIGVTIMDFASYWDQRQPELAEQIAVRFAMSLKEAETMLDAVPASST